MWLQHLWANRIAVFVYVFWNKNRSIRSMYRACSDRIRSEPVNKHSYSIFRIDMFLLYVPFALSAEISVLWLVIVLNLFMSILYRLCRFH